jgi:hypothetical protein
MSGCDLTLCQCQCLRMRFLSASASGSVPETVKDQCVPVIIHTHSTPRENTRPTQNDPKPNVKATEKTFCAKDHTMNRVCFFKPSPVRVCVGYNKRWEKEVRRGWGLKDVRASAEASEEGAVQMLTAVATSE